MITQRYYPMKLSEMPEWNLNFLTKLPTYETLLGLPGAHVDACIASLKYVNHVLGAWLVGVRELGPASTSAVDLLLYGSGPDAVVLPVFTAPALPDGVASVPPGALKRLFDLVQLIKKSPGYNESIGNDLDIIGSAQAAPDLVAAKPEFTLEKSGDHVMVKWSWQGLRGIVTAIEFRVSRGAGLPPVFLTIDSTPKYLDTEDLPATLAKWTYEGIWRDGDNRVGQWSNPVSITVGG